MSSNGLIALEIFLLLLYILPATIAVIRNHPQVLGVFFLNVLLGWTLIGWVAALIMATWHFPQTGASAGHQSSES